MLVHIIEADLFVLRIHIQNVRSGDSWKVDVEYVEDVQTYHVTVENLDQSTQYIFTVISNRTEFGGISRGGQSPPSEAVSPICTSKSYS